MYTLGEDVNNGKVFVMEKTDSTGPDVKSDYVRLEVNLNRETADALKRIAAAECGGSVTEAVRYTVGMYNTILDERLKGRSVAFLKPNGKVHRVLEFMGAVR